MLRLIVAGALIVHGIGHSMGILASWTTIPSGLVTRPSMLSGTLVMDSAIGRVFGLIWLLALVTSVGAGVGLLARQDWWIPLAIVSSVISLVAVVPWLNVMPPISAIGAVLMDLAVLGALLLPQGEQLVRSLR